jgi:hydroxymethylglutaryl-CoA lyase
MVAIVEVGPRDGLQNESTVLPPQVKVELIRRLVAAGACRIEAALRDDRAANGTDSSDTTVRYAGLVLNARGLERALAAGVDEVNVVVAASEGFARANQNSSVADLLQGAAQIADGARAAGVPASVVVSTAFGCPFDGEVAPKAVLDVVRALLDAGYREIAVADTIGVGVPGQVRELVAGMRALDGEVTLRAHFHNTRNTGYANAFAALEAGVSVLDASVGGIGGCPFAPAATGNIATEDLQYLLSRSGIETGLDLDALAATGTWVADQLGKPAPALLGRAGGFPR